MIRHNKWQSFLPGHGRYGGNSIMLFFCHLNKAKESKCSCYSQPFNKLQFFDKPAYLKKNINENTIM